MLSIKPKILYVRDQKTGRFVPLLAIRGPKGPPGSIDNITDYLTSKTGDSVELAMSQKGVTVLLGEIESEMEKTKSEFEENKSALEAELEETKSKLVEVASGLIEIASEVESTINSLKFLYANGALGLKYQLDESKCVVKAIGNAKNDTEIVIPLSICGIPVTEIGSEAFKNGTFTSITIPDSVMSIGSDAFSYCTGLTSVTIPDSVTIIGYAAFRYCSELTNITIPNSVTNMSTSTFRNCTNLTSVTIGNGVEELGSYAFAYCDNLTSVTIGNGTTRIGNSAFYNCEKLTSIMIPGSVTSIGGWTFGACESLTSITIPDSVTSIGEEAFYNCSSLTDIYYQGTEAEWANITIDESNQSVISAATIHFESPLPEI